MVDTTKYERTLLRHISGSTAPIQQYRGELDPEMFSSRGRRILFESMVWAMDTYNSVLTNALLETYLEDCPGSEAFHAIVLAESEVVGRWTGMESAETCITILQENLRERNLQRALLKATESLESRKDLDAVSDELRMALTMNSQRTTGYGPVVDVAKNIMARVARLRDKQKYPEKYMGIQTGFPEFDRLVGGLFPSELTVLSAVTGVGKSTFIKQLEFNIITHPRNGCKNVLHIANEENEVQVETKFDALFTAMSYTLLKKAELTEEEIEAWIARVQHMERLQDAGKMGRLFTVEVPAFTNTLLIEQKMHEVRERFNVDIHALFIDHLPHVMPVEKAYDKNDEQAKAAGDCKEVARKNKIPVVTAAQAATEVDEKQKTGRKPGKMSVYGSKAQVHVANTYMVITTAGPAPDGSDDGSGVKKSTETWEDWRKDRAWTLNIEKNRDGPCFEFWARHYVETGMVIACSNEWNVTAEAYRNAINPIVFEDDTYRTPEQIQEDRHMEMGRSYLTRDNTPQNARPLQVTYGYEEVEELPDEKPMTQGEQMEAARKAKEEAENRAMVAGFDEGLDDNGSDEVEMPKNPGKYK